VATLGSDPATFTGYADSGLNTQNVLSTVPYTMPVAGFITQVSVYISGDGSAINAQGAIWNVGASCISRSAIKSIAAGSLSVNGQAWQTFPLSIIWVPSGTELFIGCWRDPAKSSVWGTVSGSSYTESTSGSTQAPNSLVGTGQSHAIGAYLTYTPGHYRQRFDIVAFMREVAHPHG
jgi:hypothetical protein